MQRALVVVAVVLVGLSSVPLGSSEPTPGVNLSLERIVPEAKETNDFVSYAEARGYLDAIAEAAPDFIEVVETGDSFGWDNALTGSRDTWKVFAVEVTNEASTLTRDEKRAVVFQLSIHGNEKGGREGGLRVIEDLAIPRLYGEQYRPLLDTHLIIFTFPNVDGWNHEDLPYRMDCPLGQLAPVPCPEAQGYTRGNGQGRDMNRDWPSLGWYETQGREHALSEPEIAGLEAYLRPFFGRTDAATDIHGMLAPADAGTIGKPWMCVPEDAPENPFLPPGMCFREGHFVLGLLAAVQADPTASARTVALAEKTKEHLNAMAAERFPYWTNAPNLGFAGGEWMEWGTGWDTIGYSDSGFTGDWFGQYLGAPGLDYEMSYNHVTFDNHYLPELNDMHVWSVRSIVRGFLDVVQEPLTPRLAGEGTVAVLRDDRVLTSEGDAPQEGPHLNTTLDDAYEAGYSVSPRRFWQDLARHATPGSVVEVTPEQVAQGAFHGHRTLVIAGDAWDLVAADADAVRHLRMHLEQGNRLVLTDSALRALEALGLAAPGSVEPGEVYLGYVDLDREHALAEGVRGLARQTYDGIPLGYDVEVTAPAWTVAVDGLEGGDVAGTTLGPDRASLGRVAPGDGEVVFIGALLPTPSEETYHPYGLADYAVTYTGYQLLYNALGLTVELVPGEAPAAGEALGATDTPAPARVPGPGPALAAAALAAVGLLARRRAR